MNNLAIIPARGGSKGLPRKNIKMLAGVPLVAHAIRAAQGARAVSRVVVSTDDAEIGAVAQQYGAEVVWRPADISGDTAGSELALLHVLDTLRESEGYVPDLTVFLQCTSPLTRAEDVDGTVTALVGEDADSALAVTPFFHFLWGLDDAGEATGLNHDKAVRPLRQEREPQFLETGAVYVMRTEGFLAARHRFFGRTAMYEMPCKRVLEIDEPTDFETAERLLAAHGRGERAAALPKQIDALVMDFDGVMTNNRVLVSQDGTEGVWCNRSDALRFDELRARGIALLILSTETNVVVQARANKLRVECLSGIGNKRAKLEAWAAEKGFARERLVYVGNDVNDLECMQWVGCAVAVADAYPQVKQVAQVILTREGGDGAVREVCDLVLEG